MGNWKEFIAAMLRNK
ncbi:MULTISPECIES: hypothetical protein [Pantoea]|nr:hypothetical protein [Pantoea piersonii]MBZ6402290.1 hypothetical protein [Pantoea piersonii]MBZ6410488.1 hypothetical protein [Pantoea piersonii]MBZ6429138.1 hypothetical protein [Pantoea piersonii]UBN56293.1 hypothetical protein LB453_07670 [Pantoea agglomerans]